MKNMNDIRSKITEFADEAGVPEEYFIEFMEDFDRIVGGGTEVFELDGFSGIGWMVYRDGDAGWTWKSYETGEDDIYWGKHGSRAEAMISAAADAEENVYDYVDSRIGDRIRAAI